MVTISRVVRAEARHIPGFTALRYIDLAALGVYAAPLTVMDDFRVAALPFSAHPHAGFAAATYVFEDSLGAVRSRASTGTDVVVGAGGIVWTHAGQGVIHEEIPATRNRELHGLQLFINLSAAKKLTAPYVEVLQGSEVPEWRSDAGDRVRVVVGSFDRVSSPLVSAEPFTLLDAHVHSSLTSATLAEQNVVLYVLDGHLVVTAGDRQTQLEAGEAVALTGAGSRVEYTGVPIAHVLILAGKAIGEPVVEQGPFLMNDQSQVEAAIARYRSGAMGGLSPL